MGNACQNPHRSDEVKLYDACRKKATKKDEVERILEEFEQKEKEKILKARHGMQLQEEVEIIENARCGGYNALVQNTEFIEATPDDRLDHCNATVKELAQKEVAKIVNAHHGMNSLTALHVATMNNNLDVVTLLLKKGALVENTSLIEATDSELQEEVEIIENARRGGYGALVETTEFIEATDSSGQTALHKASKRGYTDIVKVLLEYNADPLTQDMYGRTPLELAQEYSDDATQGWLNTMPIWLKLIENSPQELKNKCKGVLSNEKVILIKTSTNDYLKIRSDLDNLEPLLDAIAKVQKEKYEHCIKHIMYEVPSENIALFPLGIGITI